MAPVSSGGVTLALLLNIMEGWNGLQFGSPDLLHREAEAMRRAFMERNRSLGDPAFVSLPIARLASDDYAAGLRAGINPDHATPSASLPSGPAPKDHVNTTHFSIIDGDGNRVAATQTVNLAYGSGMVVGGAGFLLNDEMDDFALRPGTPNAYGVMGFDANAVAPGRRMLSSMSPTFLVGKDRIAVLGAKGGSRIITSVLLGILGLEQGMDSAQIVAIPRYHHQYLPDQIFAEPSALSAQATAGLQEGGHKVTEWLGPTVLMQAVDWNRKTNEMHAGADPRNPEGTARVVLRETATQAAEAMP